MVPKKYVSPESAIASYNFTDIADGTGVIILYPIKTSDSTEDYILTANAVDAPGATVLSRKIRNASYDFDLTAFNTPRTLKGTAYMSGTIQESTTPVTLDYSCTIKKWDGSTETPISSTISGAQIIAAGNHKILLTIPLTETQFGVGEILRATIATAGCDDANAGLIVDPGETETLPTCVLYIPTKIDV